MPHKTKIKMDLLQDAEISFIKLGVKNIQPLTRNIAKSGEVLNWSGFSPFQLHLGLIVNCSQSASCHIANDETHSPKANFNLHSYADSAS